MMFESATRTVLVDHQQRGDKYYQSLQNMWGAELTSFSLFCYHGLQRCRFEPYQHSTFFIFQRRILPPRGQDVILLRHCPIRAFSRHSQRYFGHDVLLVHFAEAHYVAASFAGPVVWPVFATIQFYNLFTRLCFQSLLG